MADINANVRRIEKTNSTDLSNALKTKMLGLTSDSDLLYFKKSDGTMVPYTPVSGHADYSTLRLSSISGTGTNVSIDEFGVVYKTPSDIEDLEPNEILYGDVD